MTTLKLLGFVFVVYEVIFVWIFFNILGGFLKYGTITGWGWFSAEFGVLDQSIIFPPVPAAFT